MGTYLLLSGVFFVITTVVMMWFGMGDGKSRIASLLTGAVIGAIIGLVFLGINYFACSVITFDTSTLYIQVLLFVLILWAVTAIMVDDGEETVPPFGIATLVIFLGLIGSAIYSWDWFHTDYRQKMLQVTEVPESVTDTIVAATSNKHICTVNPVVAKRIGLTKMGDFKTTYEIAEFTKQSWSGDFIATTPEGDVRVCGENRLFYVAPLEHKSFWTWNKTGYSPAYVLVDACDENFVLIVTAVNGEPIKMVYTNGAWFSKNLERHMRSHGYGNVILDDFDFEIDENGRPWSPVTTMENSIALSTPVVTGVACCDLQTGDIKWYSPQDAPEFVDLIYPKDIVYDRIYCWGDYKNGYIHWSNNEGLTQACDGMDVVQTENGCYYYVGIQAQSDEVGTQGYMLVNTRTGEATYFRRRGISEQEAARVLESNNKENINAKIEQGVLALSEPIFYNIEGQKTYFATYVSTKDYTVKYYGFCSADDKDVWGYGETLEEAKNSYLTSFHKNKSTKAVKFADEQNELTLEANVVERVQEGNVYYFHLEGQNGKTFYAYSTILPEVRWDAHKVKISYHKTEDNLIAISSFEKVE